MFNSLQTPYVVAALFSLKNEFKNTPPGWIGSDPCGNGWEGVRCTNSRITALTLASMGLSGQLSGDIASLSELQTLDLSYNKGMGGPLPQSIGNLKKLTNLILVGCSFSGLIPNTLGSLRQLSILSLNSNNFIGPIPPEIGLLSSLFWLDLADNKLSGNIPISDKTSPGLDMLVNTKHFHFGKNQLSGEIPPQLFSSSMTLVHGLFDSNNLSGKIPSTVGLVRSLEVLRFDRNDLTGSIPHSINSLVNLSYLSLSNNRLNGPYPNLTGLDLLSVVNLSNNTFDVSECPEWFSTLESLTTLMVECSGLEGEISHSLFSLPQLQTVEMRNNQLNGTLDLGSSSSDQLEVVDLRNNLIVAFTQRSGTKIEPMLAGNPFCEETEWEQAYCTGRKSKLPYSTPPNNCKPINCMSHQILSPNCQCAYPYKGTLFFKAPSFSGLGNLKIYTTLSSSLTRSFQSNKLPVDSVSLSNPAKNTDDYFVISVQVFPSGRDRFNITGVSGIAFVLSNQIFNPPPGYGPYSFRGDTYEYFAGLKRNDKSPSKCMDIIVGAAAGSSVLVLLAVLVAIYAFRQKKRAERADKQNNPFASWSTSKSSGGIPQLKRARYFAFEELKKCTNKFSEANSIGSGGYGKVYKGTLPNGQLIAVKRAEHRSTQGGLEFKAEIELLSRVHHKNVVSLVGFCFDASEQMLVYEFIPNGSLKESLSGKSGIRLDWLRRLRIALGAARGLQYLHELANPPIIHRDIKSNNILLDERLNAKVADFGLSKPVADPEKGHITTQVKGTMGYLDPEYYMTQQLTEKSDVYSFGVLMLELITAKQPIEKGKYIVHVVKQQMDKKQSLYNLYKLLDPIISSFTLGGLENFIDLAMSCLKETAAERPKMGEVVKEIEAIMQIAGLNPNEESGSTSNSYDLHNHPYSDESLYLYSPVTPPSM